MTDADFASICTVLAGANGSDKSSAARNWLNVPGEIVNADVIARLINPEQPEAGCRHCSTSNRKPAYRSASEFVVIE